MTSVYHNALNIWGKMYQIVATKSTTERNPNLSLIKPLLVHRCITHLWIYTWLVKPGWQMRIEYPNYYGIAVIFNYHSSGSSMYKY